MAALEQANGARKRFASTATESSSTTAATENGVQTADGNQTSRSATSEAFGLLVCVIGIYTCYLKYGLLQERIYSASFDGAKFKFSAFLVAVQTATNAGVAALMIALGRFSERQTKDKQSKVAEKKTEKKDTKDVDASGLKGVPLRDYMLVSLVYLSAMLFSFTALNHMSYPMQALGKSCKMIPVMVMGILIRGKRYTPREFLCVFLITVGVAMFSFKPSKPGSTSQTSLLGLLLLLASLTMDGITGPLQERLVARHNPSTHQLMFWQNICSVVWLSGLLSVSGEGREAISFVARYGKEGVVRDMMLFAIVSAVGQNFIFYTVRNYSALAVTTITTTRKMFTVVLSIIMYKHQIAGRQWLGMVLVFVAIGAEAVAKVRAKQRKQHPPSAVNTAPELARKTQ